MAKNTSLMQLDLFGMPQAIIEMPIATEVANNKEEKKRAGEKKAVAKTVQPKKEVIVETTSTAKKSKRGRKSFKELDAELGPIDIPADEELDRKMYYSISEVSQMFHVTNSLIRSWENEFDVIKPRKNRKGDRMFRPEDIRNLKVIYHLLRDRRFSIDGAKKYLKQNQKKADVNHQLKESLLKFRSFLLELKANLGAS
jgi:DNA-binding transcriptional MerR regulator